MAKQLDNFRSTPAAAAASAPRHMAKQMSSCCRGLCSAAQMVGFRSATGAANMSAALNALQDAYQHQACTLGVGCYSLSRSLKPYGCRALQQYLIVLVACIIY
jgi:hypothetical protein